MPELPEVEVLRRSLVPHLVGRRIERCRVHRADLREPVDPGLGARLEGRRIAGLRRRAKYLLIDLETADAFAVHLGMSGSLTVVANDAPAARHEHLALHLDSGRRLRFVDPRRFGLVFGLDADREPEDRHFAHLGLEPFDPRLTGEELRHRAAPRRGPVKGFVMDARVVVGIGNIYASEVLFRAGIHPRRSVARISLARWRRLAAAIPTVLEAAIQRGGTTLADFRDGNGDRGRNQNDLEVYDRAGEPCRRCDRAILKIHQAGRSTYYCPGCQR